MSPPDLMLLLKSTWQKQTARNAKNLSVHGRRVCVEALKGGIAKHGPLEIMSRDRGRQFTGSAWITTLEEVSVRISMDGWGRYLDNIVIERL